MGKGMIGDKGGNWYPNASFRALGVAEAHAGYAVGFLVEEDDVGDGGDFGAFFADVFFNVEDGGRVLLRIGGEG